MSRSLVFKMATLPVYFMNRQNWLYKCYQELLCWISQLCLVFAQNSGVHFDKILKAVGPNLDQFLQLANNHCSFLLVQTVHVAMMPHTWRLLSLVGSWAQPPLLSQRYFHMTSLGKGSITMLPPGSYVQLTMTGTILGKGLDLSVHIANFCTVWSQAQAKYPGLPSRLPRYC